MQLTTAENQKLLAEKAEMERIIGISPAILYRHVWDAAQEQFVNAYVSPVITSLFGYEQDVFRNVNWWREHVHPDDLPLVKASTRQLFEAGEADYAFRFAVRSGQYVWIQDSPRLQKNAAGEPVEIIGSCMDISATKQAVKECKQCGLRYRSLFEDALDMIHIVDSDGRIVDANRAELITMGYSRDAYIGKPLSDFVLPECRDASMASLKAVFTGDVAQYETSLRTKHGERIDVEVYATPYREEGRVVHARAIIRNITERKRAEEKLRQKEAEYKALYAMHRRMCDNMPDMIWAKDMDNRYIFANKALCDNLLHANDTDEPIGKTDVFCRQGARYAS